MTGKAIKNLLIVAGLTLLLTIGVVLPLRAAPRPVPASFQEARVVALEITTTPPTTATVGQGTDTPAPTETPTLTSTGMPAPTETPALIPTDTPMPTDTPTLTPTETPAPTDTPTLTPTETPAPTDTPTVTPTNTLEPTNTPTPPPTPSPTSTPPPTPSPTPTITDILVKNGPVIVGGCLVLLVLFVGIALILWALRRKRPRAVVPPPPPAPAGPYLESVSPAGSPRRLYLKPEGVTLGRGSENDLVIPQDWPGWDTLSRQHARLYEQAGRWIVEDLHSMNGIYVNGRRTGRNLLRDGWRLGIGGVEFVFHAGTGEA